MKIACIAYRDWAIKIYKEIEKSLDSTHEILLITSKKKYILIAEYFNPYPIKVEYRGNIDKLFKRDFAGEMLDLYKDLYLKDYGFLYSKDNNFSKDNINWFLLEKEQKYFK